MQNLNDDEKIQIGRVVNMIVNGFQDKDYLILGSDVKFKDFGKSDILNAVKELNENNLASYKINLDNVKINFENKNLEEAEKNEFMDKDLEKYTCMTETQRKINKLKWLLFCHLEADKQSFQDLYASMLVNENVLGKNQFEILSLFPYLRLYWDLSENERKLFSNSCLPKVFFEQDFLKDMMQWHYIDDSTLIPKTKDCRQGFREMFINICQSRLDKMQKSGVSKKLDFLCESALSIYYSGNSLFHCLTKNDHGFTTIKSFCDKNSDENTFDAIKLADEFINLKKSNSPHINISGEKQKFLAFMYCFFCIDIFSQGKGTKQKFFKLPRFELCFRSLRCTFLFFFLICLIFTICEFSVFYAIMTTIVFCGNLVVSMIAKWGMFKKIDHAVTVCQQFNKVFDTMTINDLSYYKYEEYKFYTERCFNFINERLPKLQSESKDKVTQKIEFVIKVLEHQLEGSKYLEPKKEISSAMQKDFREIIANEEKMKSEKKDANENGNRLQGVFVNDIIKFDEPNLDQDNNAAPIANNDNYNDDDLPLPSLEDLLNVKRQEQEEK